MGVEHKTFLVLPPAPDKCPTCGHGHRWGEPHNVYSLYYQMVFWQEHGRWPTWADAMAHCDEQMQQVWMEELLGGGG